MKFPKPQNTPKEFFFIGNLTEATGASTIPACLRTSRECVSVLPWTRRPVEGLPSRVLLSAAFRLRTDASCPSVSRRKLAGLADQSNLFQGSQVSVLVETQFGTFRKVAESKILPLHDQWLFQCPGCGNWAYLDEDQIDGKVSVDHTNTGCSYHETHDYATALKHAIAAGDEIKA